MKRSPAQFFALLSAALLGFAAPGSPSLAQGFDIRALFNSWGSRTGSIQGQPELSTGSEWSGESGGSGHPLMSVQAIRAAADNFPNCIAGLWPLAQRRGVSRA